MPNILIRLASASQELPSTPFVVLMGVGTVFVGLVCIILLCALMGALLQRVQKQPAASDAAPAAVSAPAAPAEIANKQELVAAISAAIAEELGTDVSAIRIVSLKRL